MQLLTLQMMALTLKVHTTAAMLQGAEHNLRSKLEASPAKHRAILGDALEDCSIEAVSSLVC